MLLTRNGKPEQPRNTLSLDTEDSDGVTYVWSVQGHYNGRPVNRVFKADERQKVVKFLFQRRWLRTDLVGVNLDYDLNTLKYRGGFNWDCIYNMGKLISAFPRPVDDEKYHLGGSGIRIIEMGNWVLNKSLKAMCDDFGISGHIDKHVLGRDGNKDEMIEACTSHALCGVLAWDFITAQIRQVDGRTKLTSSSAALDMFLKNHLKEEHQIYDFKGDYPSTLGLKQRENDKDKIERARVSKLEHLKAISGLCYVGGRTEAYKTGLVTNVSAIDINSSYPFQMRNRVYPNMNTYKQLFPKLSEMEYLIHRFEGCAHVQVTAPNILIPLLHYHENGKLIFPHGTFSGWYSFPLLRTALENGYKINAVYEAAVFEKQHDFFKSYIDTMYSIKSDKSTKHVGKLLLNGLSGKFGQKTPSDAYYTLYEGKENVEIDYSKYFLFGEDVYVYTPPVNDMQVEFSHTAYPLISAYVLDYARIYLWETMKIIGFDSCYYCDTDSIHADSDAIQSAVEAQKIAIHDTELGAWSYDYERGVVEIRGLKYYRYHAPGEPWTYKMKGVRASEQASYWLNKAIWSTRVRKIKTAMRTGKRVNEFFSYYRRDRAPSSKRLFTNHSSQPYEIFE